MSHAVPYSFSIGLAVLLVFAGAAHSADRFPERARQELSRFFPKATVMEWKTGSINADAAKDIAVIISTGEASTEGQPPPEALIVLYGGPRRSFHVVAQTIQWEPHQRVWHGIDIRRKSIFLKHGCAASCGNSISSGHYQFKETNGKLFLTGEEHTEYTKPTENDDSFGARVNYLTRQVLHWRKSGKTRKEIRMRFSDSRLTPLDSFDLAAPDRLPKAARGYIDENFGFVQN